MDSLLQTERGFWSRARPIQDQQHDHQLTDSRAGPYETLGTIRACDHCQAFFNITQSHDCDQHFWGTLEHSVINAPIQCVNPQSLRLPSPVTAYKGAIKSIEEDIGGFITPSALSTPTRPDDASAYSSSASPTITLSTSANTSQSVRASPHQSPADLVSAASSQSAAPDQPIDQQHHWCEQHSKAFSSWKDLRKHLFSKEHRPDLNGHNDGPAPDGTNQCACGLMSTRQDNHKRHVRACGKPPKWAYRCDEGHCFVDRNEYLRHLEDQSPNGCGKKRGRPSGEDATPVPAAGGNS
ncbi:hypothetical protein PG985_000142 [Apiospora marii]|uniref:uncharacterized protein n=1 Tax=Apiospora marii TaxID=335849 RepID=UPI003130C6D6